jgi:hypothetical protein
VFWFTHRLNPLPRKAYDSHASKILLNFLEKRHEVTDGHHEATDPLILSHLNVNGDTQGQHLLKLELCGVLDVADIGLEILGVRDGDREFELAGLEETGPEEARGLTGELL